MTAVEVHRGTDLVVDPGGPDQGHGEQYWPRPGRIFAAARSHTFRQLADAIDDAFARWDRSHLQEFTLTGQTRLCRPDPDQEIEGEITGDYERARLSRLRPGEQFVYVFDLGDDWAHLCTVGAQRIDPVEALGILPGKPLPYWGWATFPTSTAAGGTATTATHPGPPTQGSLIFHRSGLTGGPPANGRGPGSRHCSRVSAQLGQHQPAPPGRAATAANMRVVAGNGHYSWRPWRCSSGRFPRPGWPTAVRAGKLRAWKQAAARS